MQTSFPFSQNCGSSGGFFSASALPQPFYAVGSLPGDNNNMNFSAPSSCNTNHNHGPQEFISSSSTVPGQLPYSAVSPQTFFMVSQPSGTPSGAPGGIFRPVLSSAPSETAPALPPNVFFMPQGFGGMIFSPATNGNGGTAPATTTGGTGIPDFSPPFTPIFVDPSTSRNYSQPTFSVGVPPMSNTHSGISVNNSLNTASNKSNAMESFVGANGFSSTPWVVPASSGSTGTVSFSLGPNFTPMSSNGLSKGANSGGSVYLKSSGGIPAETTPQGFDSQSSSHSSSSLSSEKFLLSQQQRPMGSFPSLLYTSPLPSGSTGGAGGRKGNVHTALQQKGLRYIPYFTSPPRPLTPSESERCAFLETQQEIPVFFQMFPCELKDRKEVLNTMLREMDPNAPIMGIVRSVTSRSETSFIAYIRSDMIWHLIQRARCRFLMDRHGCWYADTFEVYRSLKSYCENIRRMPQHNRHAVTDGLPCMPLVVELSTLVEEREIVAPPAEKCFDKEDPIQVVERHRNKK